MPAGCWHGVDSSPHASARGDGRHEGVALWYANFAMAVRGVLSASIIKHVGCVRLQTCGVRAPLMRPLMRLLKRHRCQGPRECTHLMSEALQHDHQYRPGRHPDSISWGSIERTTMNGIMREPQAAPARKTPQNPRVFQRSMANKAIPFPIRTHGCNNATAAIDTTALHVCFDGRGRGCDNERARKAHGGCKRKDCGPCTYPDSVTPH
jgi:hypothetical protein